MIKTLIVAVVFCLPQLAWTVPCSANAEYELFKVAALPKSFDKVWVVDPSMGITTSYYSPERNQGKYATGSYEGDVKLNGGGKITNCGTRPQKGLLSADLKKYPEGTRLKITSFKTGKVIYGQVQDSGKAMRDAAKKKRVHVDAYMGRGRKGLDMALAWGKQNVLIEVIILI